jgi:hypothetical protein
MGFHATFYSILIISVVPYLQARRCSYGHPVPAFITTARFSVRRSKVWPFAKDAQSGIRRPSTISKSIRSHALCSLGIPCPGVGSLPRRASAGRRWPHPLATSPALARPSGGAARRSAAPAPHGTPPARPQHTTHGEHMSTHRPALCAVCVYPFGRRACVVVPTDLAELVWVVSVSPRVDGHGSPRQQPKRALAVPALSHHAPGPRLLALANLLLQRVTILLLRHKTTASLRTRRCQQLQSRGAFPLPAGSTPWFHSHLLGQALPW